MKEEMWKLAEINLSLWINLNTKAKTGQDLDSFWIAENEFEDIGIGYTKSEAIEALEAALDQRLETIEE
jgi:hypothetical protein